MRAILAIAAAGIPVSAAGVVASPVSAAVHPARAVRPAATAYSVTGGLSGVAAASRSDAWAVGYTGTSSRKVLMVHWNGRAWSRVASPRVLTGAGSLSAITVVSAKDAWAVGSTGSDLHPRTLILHWNGRAWSAVSNAAVANGNLSAVTATPRGGWAVGYHSTGPTVVQTSPVIFRLAGTKWSRVDPNFGKGTGVAMDGVVTTSSGATFATGLYTGMITGVLARWSGSAWKWVGKFPEQGTYHWLNSIAAGRHGTAFAVGVNTGRSLGPISIRWTGRAWVRASAPRAAGLYAVAFAPGGTAWAAGSYGSGAHTRAQAYRWTGRAWSRVSSPGTSGQLNGLGFAGPSYGWAVGQAGYTRTYILHWNGRSWS